MEVIRHLVQVEVRDGNYVYINTLNGAVDILDALHHQIVEGWRRTGVQVTNESEKELALFLKKRGYFVQSRAEEETMVAQLFQRLGQSLKKYQEEFDRLVFVLTYDCNYRCPYCYEQHVQTNGMDWMKKTMTREMVDQIIERYGQHTRRVTLYGGEPLLLENRELVEYILHKMAHCTFSVTSNGYTLEEYLPLLTQYKFDLIEVTLDGTEKMHNQRRYLANGEGTYAKILQGITAALQAGLTVQLRMNIDQTNAENCNQLNQEMVQRFGHYPRFKIYRNAVFGDKYSHACRAEILEQIFESDATEAMKDVGSSLDTLHSISQVFKGGAWRPNYVNCAAHKGQLIFDAHGRLYSCWLALGKENLSLGRYFPEEELIGLPWLERTVDQMTPCKDCNKALICGGGCARQSYKEYGDIMHGYCKNTMLMTQKAIPYLYEKYVKAR